MSSLIQKLQKSSCTVAITSLTALLATWSPIAAFSQDGVVARQQQPAQATGQQQNPPAQNSITQPLALSPDVTRTRVGVKEGEVQSLALQDAIAQALQNNLDIEQFRQGVRIAEYSLFSLRGFYDYTSAASIGFRNSISPTSSQLAGSNSGTLSSKALYYNFTSSKQVEQTGGNLFAEFDNSRSRTSNIFAQLNPQYNTTLSFTYTQPLLRNFSLDATRRSIQLAKKTLDLSDSQFRQKAIDIIARVQRSYWDLVFALRDVQIQRESVDLAKTQLERNKRMVNEGTLAPIELVSVEAELEKRSENVLTAI